MKFSEKEYALNFFKKNNFVRIQCKSCGNFFWTQDKNTKICKSSPCIGYTFIKEKTKDIKLNKVRESYINFFIKNNHTFIEPRSVVARWREDIYLTIASIAVFQPFVTNGIIDPPANPLVISQPCVRLKDIDLVGITAGRHFTIFEMAAHHAFNYKNKEIYWKDDTVQYCHELNTEVFKIDPLEISYIESFWEGGGNAGICFEVASKGLELATLVFMDYKVENGKLIKMPLYIVDTGYGLERYAWFLSGKPSAFHAIYNDLINWLFNKIGLTKDVENIIFEHARLSSFLQEEKEFYKEKIREQIKVNLGIKEDINPIIDKLEASYALLDHTKCITFLLADGLVPSNSGEGYLGRLVIRKALKNLKTIELDIPLASIIEKQIKLWGNEFKKIKISKERIKEIIEIEEEKYDQVLKRAKIEIRNVINKTKKQGKKTVELKSLIDLYDTHGIHPEFVIKEANKEGLKVEFPLNFFYKVLEKHESKIKEIKEEKFPEIKGIKETYPLYYDNPYLEKFKAKIIETIEPNWVILDKTAFYPEGGGQIYDTGKLIVNGKEVKIKQVYKTNGIILHKVDYIDNSFKGKEVEGIIDYERRLNIMRHHTATHILLQSIKRVLGPHIWQAGTSKEENKARLDVTHYKKITEKEIEEIENLANEIVLKNLKVKAKFMNRKEAEEKYGFTLYQGGVMDGKNIRVVSIENFDHQACGGTHVKETGEVGLIKIIKTERIQDGIERFIYTAGNVSLKEIRKSENTLKFIAETLNIQKEKVVEKILKLTKELKNERKESERLRKKFALTVSEILFKERKKIKNAYVYEYISKELSSNDLIEIGDKIIKKDKNSIVLLASITDKVLVIIMLGENISKIINVNNLISVIAKEINGKGGGRINIAQASGPNVEGLKKGFSKVKEIINKL